MVDLGPIDLRAGKEPGPREDGRLHVEEIEPGKLGGQLDVGLEEVPDSPDVLPVALVGESEDAVGMDRVGDDVLAEIGQIVVEQFEHDVPIEQVDPHRPEKMLGVGLHAQPFAGGGIDMERVQDGWILGLLDEAGDAALGIDLEDAQARRSLAGDGDGGDRDVGIGLHVLLDDPAHVDPIKLIAAQDQGQIEVLGHQVQLVLPDSVGGPLIPRVVGEGLLGGEDLDEPVGVLVELVGLRDVPVQRGRVELSEQVDPLQPRVDAVGDRDVHQAILASQRHRRFGALLGQREQARALPTAHNDGQHVIGTDGREFGRHSWTLSVS